MKKNNIIVAILCLLIVLSGYLSPHVNITNIGYLVGSLLFIAGLLLCLNFGPGAFTYFLLISGAGLFLILYYVLDIFNNNINFQNNELYLGLILIIFVITIIYTLLHNLSPLLKNKPIHKIIILILYLICFILISIFPNIL